MCSLEDAHGEHDDSAPASSIVVGSQHSSRWCPGTDKMVFAQIITDRWNATIIGGYVSMHVANGLAGWHWTAPWQSFVFSMAVAVAQHLFTQASGLSRATIVHLELLIMMNAHTNSIYKHLVEKN